MKNDELYQHLLWDTTLANICINSRIGTCVDIHTRTIEGVVNDVNNISSENSTEAQDSTEAQVLLEALGLTHKQLLAPLYFPQDVRVSADLIVSISEEPGAKHRGSGTTGGLVWNCSRVMSRLIACDQTKPNPWRGRRVLELGCGTGLLGITAACIGAHVTLTDLPQTLSLTKQNASNNVEKIQLAGGSTVVKSLDWTNSSQCDCILQNTFDTVLCSDLVFGNTAGWSALLNLMSKILSTTTRRNPNPNPKNHENKKPCKILFGFEERPTRYPSPGFWKSLRKNFFVTEITISDKSYTTGTFSSTTDDTRKQTQSKISVFEISLKNCKENSSRKKR